jgi:hypothetical protein
MQHGVLCPRSTEENRCIGDAPAPVAPLAQLPLPPLLPRPLLRPEPPLPPSQQPLLLQPVPLVLPAQSPGMRGGLPLSGPAAGALVPRASQPAGHIRGAWLSQGSTIPKQEPCVSQVRGC